MTVENLAERAAAVRERIARAAGRNGRRGDAVKLIAVSKTHQAGVLREAMAAGLRVFGENKVQEAEGKIAEIADTNSESCEWHLIGNLQSNKARKAVRLFDVIHSVDNLELAARLERISLEEERSELPILVQVDLADEVAKSGVALPELPRLVDYLQSCKHLKFIGLMILPPYFDKLEMTRPYFKRLRELRDELNEQGAFSISGGELSMGMSHDFEAAIEEGATIVRVGTAIFGERSYTQN
jgi:hypothetical protein